MKLDIKLENHDSLQIQMAGGHILTIRTHDDHEFSITSSSEALCAISSGSCNVLNFRTDTNRFGPIPEVKKPKTVAGKGSSGVNRGPYKKKKQQQPAGGTGGNNQGGVEVANADGAEIPNPQQNGESASRKLTEVTA
ncbi:hypothetical protein [Chitinophaga barathri]|uniref:Uncharacterized protein n=1 Tax=Chitinophaga barathri TaxID=1647451 RepID=A0A3N4M7P7_9BACT|nr:hypothetical protein [Chitinophaga barathri]RPD39318.1 hypothetical protein EG028_19520 [Chitinophaga barathri]